MSRFLSLVVIGYALQWLGYARPVAAFLAAVDVFGVIVLIWRKIAAKRRLWAVQSLLSLSAGEFEQLTADIFRKSGYRAKVAGKSGDRGIDVVLHGKRGEKIGVQCKRYEGNIGSPLIREFAGALDGAGMRRGFFATTSDYTREAVSAAQRSSLDIVLLSGAEIARMRDKLRTA